MNSNIIVKAADPSFRVKAFEEYTSRAMEKYQRLINMFESIPDYIPDDDDVIPNANTITQNLMEDHEFDNILVPLSNGYVRLEDLLYNLVRAEIDQLSDQPVVPDGTFEVPAEKVTGEKMLQDLKLSIDGVADELISNLHSVTSLWCSLSAFSAKVMDPSIDVISVFDSKMNGVFADAKNDISSTANYLKDLTINYSDPTDYLNQILEVSGLKNEAEAEPDSDFTPENSEMYKFTGASPSCALDFSSAAKAVGTVAKVAAKVVVGVVKGVANLAGKLFKGLFNSIRNVISNPNDLEISVKKGFGSIDGFRYQIPVPSARIDLNYPLGSNVNDLYDIAYNELESKINKWIGVKTKFGEWMFRYHDVSISSLSNVIVCGDVEVLFKPRYVNTQVLADAETGCETAYEDTRAFTERGFEQFLDNLEVRESSLHDPSGTNEYQRYCGFLNAVHWSATVSSWGLAQMEDRPVSHLDCYGGFAPSHLGYSHATSASSVTNRTFLELASGWDQTSQKFTSFAKGANLQATSDSAAYVDLSQTALEMFKMVMYAIIAESASPFDAAFVPFSNNTVDFEKPTFSIRTDAQNKQAFNTFFTTAIIVVVVAAVALTAVVTLKKLAKKRFLRAVSNQRNLETKLASGEKLTRKETRKLLKARKKLGMSTPYSSSLAGAKMPSQTADPSTSSDVSLSSLTMLISGSGD